MSEGAPREFRVVDAPLDGAPGVRVEGEVDVASVTELAEALDEAIRTSEGAFVLDLCEVEFLDSRGLSVVLRARALLGRDERALVIVCPPGPVHRLFEVTGTAELLFVYDSRDDAAAELVPRNAG
jgi:anti-anti-sigma factor